MKRLYDAKLGMYKAVKAVLTANATTITAATVPIIGTYETDLIDHIEAIENISVQTEIDTRGITIAKEDAKKAVIISACSIAGAIYSYSVDTNNIILAHNTNTSSSTLEALKDEELIPIARNIHSKALQFVTVTPPAVNPLANYGVGTPEVTALGALIQSYSGQITAPRNTITKRKTSNKFLAEQFKLTDELLYKFDRIILGQKYAYPEFCTQYFNARELVGPMTMRTQIIGVVSKITDTALMTTAVVEGAKVTVVSEPYTTIKNKQLIQIIAAPIINQTDGEGKFAIPTPDFRATYTVTCSLAGYAEQQITNVEVWRGKKTKMNFLLEPLLSG